MNILVCDDMKPETEKLSRLLQDTGFDVNIVSCYSGYDALEYVRSGAVIDLCFLDIIMPEMSGIGLAEILRADGFAGEIVFLTATNEYAAESYRVRAFSYLLKPPSLDDVRNTLCDLSNNRKKGDTGGILLKVSKISRFVLFRDISHVEVISHYVYFRLLNGEEIEIYATLGEIAAQLFSDRRFAQCHRSYVVNMSDIVAIDDRQITMRNGKRIPISRKNSDIREKYVNWVIERDRN